MKLQEFHAKRLLLAQGLPVPDYSVAETAAEARAAAEPFLAAGRRARSSSRRRCSWVAAARPAASSLRRAPRRPSRSHSQILGMDIKGTTVRRVLVAPAADIVSEFYLACVLDRSATRRSC